MILVVKIVVAVVVDAEEKETVDSRKTDQKFLYQEGRLEEEMI